MSLSNTQVVNVRDLPEGWTYDEQYVYIGRTHGMLRGSRWANPFRVGRGKTRLDVLRDFRAYFNKRLRGQFSDFREATLKLAGKTLVCWCKPLVCHGDIIVAYLDAAIGEQR